MFISSHHFNFVKSYSFRHIIFISSHTYLAHNKQSSVYSIISEVGFLKFWYFLEDFIELELWAIPVNVSPISIYFMVEVGEWCPGHDLDLS